MPSTALWLPTSSGRVFYANTVYLDLIGATGVNDVRPIERVFIGDPDVSEAIYRLLKAAREGRRLQEEVRIAAATTQPARWLRLRVRPLGESKNDARMTVWSIADVTRDRERQENVFQELQHAIDYLDHAPAGFFSADSAGDIVYLNATLATWLDHDLAQVGAGSLKLADIVAGEGAALLTTLNAAPGEVKTEVLDLDLKTRGGKPVPARLFHKVAFGADGLAGASRTLVLNRAKDDGSDSAARRGSALHAILPEHADGDRHGRQERPHRAQQRPLRIGLRGHAQARRAVDPVGGGRARPPGAGSFDPQGGRRPGRYRAGRGRARRQQRALGDFLRVGGGGRGARRRGGHRLCARDHHPADAGKPGLPAAKDGVGRPACRRHRARFQQCAVGHHDGDRFPAQRAQADRSVVPGHHPDQAERQSRRGAGAAIAGVLAQADAAAAGARPQRDAQRPDHAVAPADRREGHLDPGVWPRSLAGEGGHLPVGAGGRQSRGQCARRHAGRRQAHHTHHQRAGHRKRRALL